jgi:5-aminopentanamidase
MTIALGPVHGHSEEEGQLPLRVASGPAPDQAQGGAVRQVDELLGRAARQSADLLVLPELALGGSAGARPAASDSDLTVEIAARCGRHGVALALGYLESCSGRLHSSCLFVDRAGDAIANYRCTHLGGMSAELSPGQWLTIVPFGGRRIGLMIGHDLLFPEVARALVLQGADLLLVLGGRPTRWATALAEARSLENGTPMGFTGWAAPGDRHSIRHVALDGRGDELPIESRDPDLHLAVHAADGSSKRLRAERIASRRARLYQRLTTLEQI